MAGFTDPSERQTSPRHQAKYIINFIIKFICAFSQNVSKCGRCDCGESPSSKIFGIHSIIEIPDWARPQKPNLSQTLPLTLSNGCFSLFCSIFHVLCCVFICLTFKGQLELKTWTEVSELTGGWARVVSNFVRLTGTRVWHKCPIVGRLTYKFVAKIEFKISGYTWETFLCLKCGRVVVVGGSNCAGNSTVQHHRALSSPNATKVFLIATCVWAGALII